MIMTDGGIVIRISLTQVNELSRTARGVKLINVGDDQKVSSVAIVDPAAEDEETEATPLPEQDPEDLKPEEEPAAEPADDKPTEA
jgi:DNA gyrase subunit A